MKRIVITKKLNQINLVLLKEKWHQVIHNKKIEKVRPIKSYERKIGENIKVKTLTKEKESRYLHSQNLAQKALKLKEEVYLHWNNFTNKFNKTQVISIKK